MAVRKENFYEVLHLDRNASQEQIEEAFSQEWHLIQKFPFAGAYPAQKEKEWELLKAFAILQNPVKRQRYDETLDFPLVLLDTGKIPEEFLQYYSYQKLDTPWEYKENLSQFRKFKESLEDALWTLKGTTMFFVAGFSLITLASIGARFGFSEGWIPAHWEEYLQKYGAPVATGFLVLNFLAFKYFFQIPRLQKRKNKRLEN